MRFLKGIGIIVGLMFGAGVFALPFAISQAGIFWGIAHLVVAITIMLLLLFLYAEISYYTKGKHRFAGYVGLILGKNSKILAFVIISIAYYGALLAYGVLGGIFLSSLVASGANYTFWFSLLFFTVGSVFVFLKLDKIASINFYLTIPLFGFVVYLLFTALPFIDLNNFSLTFDSLAIKGSWFLPYGIWLFSLGAFGAIPEVRDIFLSSKLKSFKRVILASILLSAFFYCLFILAIVGVSGDNTSTDALSGIVGSLRNSLIVPGAIMGVLAVFTSFLALGIDLRGVFRYDFGLSKVLSAFLVVIPPMAFFVGGFQDFARVLSFVGAVGIGFIGTLIILMARKLRKKKIISKGLKIGLLLEMLVITAILLAVVYEIYNILF